MRGTPDTHLAAQTAGDYWKRRLPPNRTRINPEGVAAQLLSPQRGWS